MILPHRRCISVPKNNFPSILLLNARSIFNKMDELTCLVSSVRPHIVAISESWLNPDVTSDLLSLNGYAFYRKDRVGRIGGGVCLWLSNSFRSSVITSYESPSSTEVLFVRILSLKLLLCVAYIPPSLSSAEKNSINTFFEDVLDRELSTCPDLNLIICGDFNDFNTSIFLNYFSLKNCVESPTRGQAILDHIWISPAILDQYVSCAWVGPPLGTSDHGTVFLPTKCHAFSPSQRTVKVKDYRMSHLVRFSQALSLSDFSILEYMDSLDQKCSAFYEILDNASSCIPVEYVVMNENDKPWVTPLLKLLINKRWAAYRSKDWPRYVHFKEKVKLEINKAKRIWANRQTETCRGTWTLVNELRGKKTSSTHNTSNPAETNNLLLSATDLFKSNFNDQPDCQLKEILDEPWNPMFSVSDVERELTTLNERKSAGSDGVAGRLLRFGSPWLAKPLYYLFLCSILSRTVPTHWKLADVTPISKCRAPTPRDYRPISLLPAAAKILERLVLRWLRKHLLHLYGPQQHAFRPHGSTSSALIVMHDCITRFLDNSDILAVRVVCLDFSKAFDKIQHNRLLNYLHDNGINGGCLRWLRDYLSRRRMRVKLDGKYGPQFDVLSGVPQGSILGPYLFAAFMGSLSRYVDAELVIYADDVSLIEPLTRQNCHSAKLAEIEAWITQSCFALNYCKSKQMILSRSTTRHNNFTYPAIEVVDDIKILGVHWDNRLTWEKHFDKIIKSCSQRLYIIRILKRVLPNQTLILVYHSLITSLLLYAAPLFSWLPCKIEHQLEKFQRRAHRLICSESCTCAAFPPLASVRKKRAVTFLICCENFKDHPLHPFVPQRLPRSGHFRLPCASTSRRLHSFFPHTCQLANFPS